ncbi:hypothetical protein [Thalassotalea atypica]|uniref:hypothetical protein n=1 Tax=Thalassotalea atypica TaxID=2054316 RepID=UPI002573FE45|nr:hypothetical protein [Thalassotalea atypica]
MHSTIVNVSVRHDYYVGGFLQAFDYQLSNQSKILFHNADAIFRTHINGFEILATEETRNIFQELVNEYETDVIEAKKVNVNKTKNDEKVALPTPPAIIVRAYDVDRRFIQLTSTSIRPNNTCYFISNITAQLSNLPFLHVNQYVGEENVKSLNHVELMPWLVRKDWFNTPVILFCFYLSDVLLQLNQNQESDHGLNYTIGFEPRQNIWKYLIFGAEKYQGITIKDLDNNVNFQFEGSETVGGKTSLVYTSKEPVKLKENTNQRFQLKAEVNEIETILIKRLPLASITQVNSKTLNGKQTVVSEIFVNL